MYGVGRRCGLDTTLLWLWHRMAATAPIQPLAWQPAYAMGAALKKSKKKKKKKKRKSKKKRKKEGEKKYFSLHRLFIIL